MTLLGLQMKSNRWLALSKKNRRWLTILVIAGLSTYGAYKAYNLPIVARQRRKLSKLLDATVSLAELTSDSSEIIRLVSKDLKDFLTTDSNEIPRSLKQISKLARSPELSESLINLSRALTIGTLCGFNFGANQSQASTDSGPEFVNKVMNKMSSDSGTRFVSIVVGSLARNLVSGYVETTENDPIGMALADERCKGLILSCVERFVSTGVAVFLEKTKHINAYEEFFAALTNPKHQERMRDVVVSVCNNAVETLVRTSHQVLCNGPGPSKGPIVEEDDGLCGHRSGKSITRYFGEYALLKMCDGMRRGVKVAKEEVVERGMHVVGYVGGRSYVVLTICLALCLHFVGGSRVLLCS